MADALKIPVSFALPNTGIICGQCHYQMDSSMSKNDIPVEFRAKCLNDRCPNFGKLFRVGDEVHVSLTEIPAESK